MHTSCNYRNIHMYTIKWNSSNSIVATCLAFIHYNSLFITSCWSVLLVSYMTCINIRYYRQILRKILIGNISILHQLLLVSLRQLLCNFHCMVLNYIHFCKIQKSYKLFFLKLSEKAFISNSLVHIQPST